MEQLRVTYSAHTGADGAYFSRWPVYVFPKSTSRRAAWVIPSRRDPGSLWNHCPLRPIPTRIPGGFFPSQVSHLAGLLARAACRLLAQSSPVVHLLCLSRS